MPSCRYRFRTFATILIAFAATVTTGCKSDGIDNSTPEAAYEAYRQAMHDGAWETVFQLLKPDLQQKITATLDLNRQTMHLIELKIRSELKANYLDSIGPPELRNATTPAAYFAATLGRPARASDSMGTTVSSKRIGITENPAGSNRWVVRTLGGERINIHGGTDGRYYVVPDEADSDRINQELKNAGDRLVMQQHIAAALDHPKEPSSAPTTAPTPAPDARP